MGILSVGFFEHVHRKLKFNGVLYVCILGKLQVLDVMLHQLKSSQRRVMVFTQMTKMLDILEVFLSSRGYSYLRMDGAASVKQKQVSIFR